MGERKFPIRRSDAWKNRVGRFSNSDSVRKKRKRMDKVAANPALKIRMTPVWKRILDLGLSIPALIVLAPLFAVIGLAIWLQDRRPIFFASIRIGKDGVPFEFLKFRTMVIGAEALKESLSEKNIHGPGITFKVKDDPRITPVGKILRRFSPTSAVRDRRIAKTPVFLEVGGQKLALHLGDAFRDAKPFGQG